MKQLIFVLAIVIGLHSNAQTEQENYNAITSEFQNLYNDLKYDEIYNLFNVDMKKALSLDQTRGFLGQFQSGFGKIEAINLLRIEVSNIYEVKFEKANYDMSIVLDTNNMISGLFFKPHKPDNLPKLERNITKMILPFKEEWFVFWGGTEVAKNYHVAYENQQYAYDLMMIEDGRSFKGDPKKNESYFVFGKDIIAPCDAKVARVITGVNDNIPGELNPAQLTGNTIVLETSNNEFLLFAHLKKGSIVVKEGQEVNQGDLLGQCGNSGNTTEPHLHLSLQNVLDMNIATGAKLFFEKINVNGEIKEDYLPEKNDKIQNIKL